MHDAVSDCAGTLTPIVNNPDQAIMSDQVRIHNSSMQRSPYCLGLFMQQTGMRHITQLAAVHVGSLMC